MVKQDGNQSVVETYRILENLLHRMDEFFEKITENKKFSDTSNDYVGFFPKIFGKFLDFLFFEFLKIYI